MYTKKNIFGFGMILLFSVILWSCSDSPDHSLEDDLTLEQLMEVKANALSDAVVEISETEGFKIITLEDRDATKSGNDSRPQLEINLTDINGVYEYTSGLTDEQSSTKVSSQKRFEKVSNSEDFILRLPKEKAMKPWKLYVDEGVEYVNDFVITTSDYNYSFSDEGFNYILDSEIEVEEEKVGELYVAWSIMRDIPIEYKSEFVFPNAYSVGVEFGIGEMLTYEFSLKKGDEIIYKEEVNLTSSEDDEGELEYAITIGNIKIVVNSELDTYMIYRDGVLDEGATIQIVQFDSGSDGVGNAFCRKGRDIKISFANGDIIELSEFISDETLGLMDEIFSSMYDMKFVKHVVDKVARQVYYNNINSNTED